MSFGSTITGAFAGLTAGVAIGLLIAPEKGSETRRKIADTAEAWKEKCQRLMGKGQTELDQLKHIFEHEVTGLKDDVKQRILTLIEESRHTYSNLKDEVTG
ncbi:YtxH domain-containing protein [Compostibacter hankyongensis]|uniref:YtxH domain-containing protein n=1 Tax=Compostibacter hankyongensis TaxID=1007089 RepID=A0ABP8FN97_9BACT